MGEVQLYHNVAIMLIRFIGASMNLMCYFGLESFSSNMWLMLGHQWKKAIYVGFGSIKGNSRQIHIKDFMMLLQLMWLLMSMDIDLSSPHLMLEALDTYISSFKTQWPFVDSVKNLISLLQ